jgi:endonuclease-3
MWRALRACYGAPGPPVSPDPFRLILWEQVAYLAADERRQEAFEALRNRIGLSPAEIAAASQAQLAAVARIGGAIAATTRAARMRRSAQMVLARWHGDLRGALQLPVEKARRALAAFPMIGEPGADKILAFAGAAPLVAIDSNGLRVLQRLGLAPASGDYRRDYRAARDTLASHAPRTQRARIAAYFLLREHGRRTCRRSAPQCEVCPLLRDCPTGRAKRRGR